MSQRPRSTADDAKKVTKPASTKERARKAAKPPASNATGANVDTAKAPAADRFSPFELVLPKVPQVVSKKGQPDRRGHAPKRTELAVIAGAVRELSMFGDYAEVFGKTVPDHATMLGSLQSAQQWSSLRTQLAAWDAYCALQEGTSWKQLRAGMTSLKSAFERLVEANAGFATKYPHLVQLLQARAVIATQGASTRTLNKQAVAEGKSPTHGKVGKRRKRRAAKKALEGK